MNLRRIDHDQVESTSERAFAALAAGSARHGDVHVARSQTAGHGRFGRPWHSPAGEGVYASAIFLPPPPPWSPAAVTVAGALAVFDAALALGAREAWLDWPNDLMVERAKLAGVLVETRGLDARKPHYVVGIGLNVAQRAFPAALTAEREVTSLARLGVEANVERATSVLLEWLGRRIEQIDSTPAELEVDFVHATRLAQREVLVRSGESEERGVFAGLSFGAGLLLHGAGGREKRLPLEFIRSVTPL